jgi:hypothetical protein
MEQSNEPKFQRHPMNKINIIYFVSLKHTIFRCRLNERILFKSLIDTFGSISLLINRTLLAINTVLKIPLDYNDHVDRNLHTERTHL